MKVLGHTEKIKHLKKIYSSDKIPQTMLFSGTPGIGKKIIAKSCLKMLFCSSENKPCGTCSNCKKIASGAHPDFIVVSPDEKGKIPLGDRDKKEYGSVRWLIHRLTETPFSGKFAVIIDGVDRISDSGQNALLKTIEEPNSSTNIILITSQLNGILQTIKSRSSIVKFSSLTIENCIEILRTKHEDAEETILEFAAIAGGGSVERAEVVLAKNEEVLAACVNIKEFIINSKIFSYDLDSLNKELSPSGIVPILINIYGYILETLLTASSYNIHFGEIYIDSEYSVRKLLKMLTALMKSENFNINKTVALKAMLFEFKTDSGREMPFLERINI